MNLSFDKITDGDHFEDLVAEISEIKKTTLKITLLMWRYFKVELVLMEGKIFYSYT